MLFACKEQGEKTVSLSTKAAEPEKSEVSTSLYQDLEGNAISLDDYKGKRVLLNYWATWCRPCIEEMPSMLRLQDVLAGENYVFLLASDQSFKIIKSFKEKKGFDFNFVKFNGSLRDLQINALPVTFIYNEKGEEIDRITGGVEWDAPEMIEKLKAVK